MTPWVLLISWAVNGVGMTSANFQNLHACESAAKWSYDAQRHRKGAMNIACINNSTGQIVVVK